MTERINALLSPTFIDLVLHSIERHPIRGKNNGVGHEKNQNAQQLQNRDDRYGPQLESGIQYFGPSTHVRFDEG